MIVSWPMLIEVRKAIFGIPLPKRRIIDSENPNSFGKSLSGSAKGEGKIALVGFREDNNGKYIEVVKMPDRVVSGRKINKVNGLRLNGIIFQTRLKVLPIPQS